MYMKKYILALSVVLMASNAFAAAGSFVPGTVYSVGSVTKSSFKTSPKVTINYVTDVAAGAAATDWAATAYHASALGNKKGNGYWTSKSDPGLWYYKDDAGTSLTATLFSGAATLTAPTEKTAGATLGWAPDGK